MTLVVGIGGTTAATSTSQKVLHQLLARCESRGAETLAFTGDAIDLPHYRHEAPRSAAAEALVAAMRRADAIAIVSPGYHGTISGLLKNALDYAQDLAEDRRPYFDGRAVGLVSVAAGWQAAGSTLATLRTIAHALRGWPTPLGVTINSAAPLFDHDGTIAESAIAGQLDALAGQLLAFPARGS